MPSPTAAPARATTQVRFDVASALPWRTESSAHPGAEVGMSPGGNDRSTASAPAFGDSGTGEAKAIPYSIDLTCSAQC